MINVVKADDLRHYLNTLQTCPFERSVDEATLTAFTAISKDKAEIHQLSANSVVIPGNLLISLLPAMLQSGLHVQAFDHCKTVSIAKLRFFNSVSLDELLCLDFKITAARRRGNNCFVTTDLILATKASKQKVLSAVQTDCYVN